MGKDCSDHKARRQTRNRRCCAAILIILFLILLTILIVWAVLQPRSPRFVLQDATIFTLNVSAPYIVTTSLQITINSHNRNNRIGIYYDRLDVFATYHNQQITYYTAINPVYQGHKDSNIWSPFVYGNMVPVAPYNGPALSQDQANGAIGLLIKIDGRLRWKVGSITTGRYRFHVRCPAYIPLENHNANTGIVVGAGVKYQLAQRCRFSL